MHARSLQPYPAHQCSSELLRADSPSPGLEGSGSAGTLVLSEEGRDVEVELGNLAVGEFHFHEVVGLASLAK